MSAQHTPGRIFLAEAVTGRHSKTNMRRVRSESEGLEHGAICEVYGIADGSPAHANARRLVACWNACEGVPTELLEAYPAPFTELRTQRDELLAALSRIAKWNEHTTEFAVDFGSNGVRDFYRGIASRAIAKVKGGAL